MLGATNTPDLSEEQRTTLEDMRDRFGAVATIRAYISTHEVESGQIMRTVGKFGAERAFGLIFGIAAATPGIRSPGVASLPAPAAGGAKPASIRTPGPAGPPELPGKRLATPSGPGQKETPAFRAGLGPPIVDTSKAAGLQDLSTPHVLADRLIALSKTYGVPLSLVMAMMKQESQFDPRAANQVGAGGLMQLMPATARELGLKVGDDVDERFDALKNVEGGLKYVQQLRQRYKADTIDKVLAGYNAGPGRLKDNAYQKIPETVEYLEKVKANYEAYNKDPNAVAEDIMRLHQNISTEPGDSP